LQAPEHVRPELGLDEDHSLGPDQAQRTQDVLPAVDRVVDLRNMSRETLLELGHAGGGRGGDDELVVGQARFERLDELRAEIDLPDADGVQPDHPAVGKRLFEQGVILSKTLAEPPAPVAAPPHLQKIEGRGHDKAEIEEDVIEKPHCLGQLDDPEPDLTRISRLRSKNYGCERKLGRLGSDTEQVAARGTYEGRAGSRRHRKPGNGISKSTARHGCTAV
jgi:hypothetical protein